MGIIKEVWRCVYCNKDVGGSEGALRYHLKRAHEDIARKE